MLGAIWRIFRWLVGLPLEGTRTDRERKIFTYWDGQRFRRADPLAVVRGLSNDPKFDLETTPAAADRGDLEAVEITCNAARSVLKIPSLEDGGLTDAECFETLIAFFDFCAALKKNSKMPPTSPEPTELPSLEASTMQPGSDCGSIASESSAASLPG